MFRVNRPAPLHINDINELKGDFRPRWVKLRFRLVVGISVAALPLMFVIAVLSESYSLVLTLCLQPLVIFIVAPKHTVAFIGLLVRHFPRLAAGHRQFEKWLQFDLDYNEERI